MRIKSIRDATLDEMNRYADTFFNACGYEARSCSLARQLKPSVANRLSLSFKEWKHELSRIENEQYLLKTGYRLIEAAGSDSSVGAKAIMELIDHSNNKSIAIDISSMTRTWHGGIVRALRSANRESDLETFFAYAPARFSPPPKHSPTNEVVAPVDGFASLVTPDLPIALILGLGYERDRALGLQQLLDPKKTVIMIPRFRSRKDLYYEEVLKANRDLLESVHRDLQYDYWIDEPSSAFGELASIVSGLISDYRVVLASLGPKIFGLECFLLATKMPHVSVWRASSGIHGKPRQSRADEHHPVVLNVVWMRDSA